MVATVRLGEPFLEKGAFVGEELENNGLAETFERWRWDEGVEMGSGGAKGDYGVVRKVVGENEVVDVGREGEKGRRRGG